MGCQTSRICRKRGEDLTDNRIGILIDRLYDVKQDKGKANEGIKKINEKIAKLETEIIKRMEAEKTTAVKGRKASASITMAFYPSVEDIEKFARWCVRRKRFDMFRKQVSSAPVKEYYDDKNLLPDGVKTHTETKLNLRRK